MQQAFVRRPPEPLEYFGIVIDLQKVRVVERRLFVPGSGDAHPHRLSREEHTIASARAQNPPSPVKLYSGFGKFSNGIRRPQSVCHARYSSSCRSLSSTPRSSSVVTSPATSEPEAISLSSRRMIFP